MKTTIEFGLRFVWALVTIALYAVIDFVCLAIPGLLLVHLAIRYRVGRQSRIGYGPIVTAPDWLWVYGNEEDGYLPLWWLQECAIRHPSWSRYRIMYHWAAIRNSTNNMRFIRWLHPPQRDGAVKWLTIGRMMVLWQGVFSRIVWNSDKLWIGAGWKYEASYDIISGWQKYGCGFGIRKVTK